MNSTIDNLDLTSDQVSEVLSSITIPSCPEYVQKALAESQKDFPNIKKLSQIISTDPGMSAATLKLVNSVLFNRGTPIVDVQKAVERLGTNIIVCVIIGVALKETGRGLPKDWLDKFWFRTSQIATAATIIAKTQYGIAPDAAYTYALFHESAIPMMMKRFTEYKLALENSLNDGKLLFDIESQQFPCTHPVIGSLMLRSWGLPPNLGVAIRFHHDLEILETQDKSISSVALSLISITNIAEQLVYELLNEENVYVSPRAFDLAVKFLGVTDTDIEDYREKISQILD